LRDQQQRDTPAARGRRAAGRFDLSGLDDGQAVEATRRSQPGLFSAPAWGAGLSQAQHVTGFLGDFVARVQAPGGRRGLVVSTVPLRSSLGGQGERPVDLSLRDQGSGFAPVNPVVATVIPKHSSDEVQVGQIGLRLPSSGSHAARLTGGKVVYPNVLRDTDSTVTAIPGGIEEFSVLRSPNSPVELSWLSVDDRR